MEYKIKDFNNRSALETQIISDFGRTVDKKDAHITGTVLQLEELGLRHNQTIWGVSVEASNYQVNNNPRVKRGKRTRSQLNGVNQ